MLLMRNLRSFSFKGAEMHVACYGSRGVLADWSGLNDEALGSLKMYQCPRSHAEVDGGHMLILAY